MSLDMKALKEAAGKATPGEWWRLGRTIAAGGSSDTFSGAVYGVIAVAEPCVQQDSDGRTWSAKGDELSNAAFIALANPSTILSLIERVEAATQVIEETRDIVSAGALEGFRPLEGEWADRLYRNQAKLSGFLRDAAALSKADATS